MTAGLFKSPEVSLKGETQVPGLGGTLGLQGWEAGRYLWVSGQPRRPRATPTLSRLSRGHLLLPRTVGKLRTPAGGQGQERGFPGFPRAEPGCLCRTQTLGFGRLNWAVCTVSSSASAGYGSKNRVFAATRVKRK